MLNFLINDNRAICIGLYNTPLSNIFSLLKISVMPDSENRHYAVIDAYHRKLTLQMDGKSIASTTNAFILKEVGKSVYDPVFYIPREDVSIELKPESERASHCPIKGDASYWNLESPTSEYFAWSYESPHPRAKKIKGYVAFNLKYVSLISEPI